jgi:two-component system NtrC family response regulator
MEKLLIVDDNDDIRQQLKWGLAKEYSVLLAADGREGMTTFRKQQPKVVILDLGMPPHEDSSVEGFRCLEEMLAENPNAKVIVMTGNAERDNALRAIQLGAYDFYPKPPVLNELKVILARAYHLANIEEQNRALRHASQAKVIGMGGMVGQCPEMQTVFTTIRKVATTDVPVLITGESGTGKELVARAIHEQSSRRKGPFIPINCGAIPENLMESELFGHERGAFTGAHAMVMGKIQCADKGTLFLDELGELPANLQVKLLRYLQDSVIQRVGGRDFIPVDVRVVCATNVDIDTAIREGKLREDLYYRVGVITIHLLPLRERKEDRLLLATHFLNQFSDEYQKKVKRFSAAAIQEIESFEWPGNVRELRNRIQRAVIMCDGNAIEPQDLAFTPAADLVPIVDRVGVTTLKAAREQLEKELVTAAIERQHGNIVKAAEELGVSRPTFYDLLRKYGLHVHSPDV